MTQERKTDPEVTQAVDNGEKIAGYYKEHVKITLGTGATKRATTGENIFYAEELPSGEIKLSLLNMAGQPTNITEVVEREEFFRRCTPEPDFVPPAEKSDSRINKLKELADRHASQGNLHLRRKEYNSAEFEFNRSLKLDEEHVRANYGLAKLHLEKGEEEEARRVLDRLTHIEALFEEENKHIFNEFGIDLRKMKMYQQALDSYTKALEIKPDDPVLNFNKARALIDLKRFEEALAHLERALELKEDFPEAQQIARLLKNKLRQQKGSATQ